MNPNDFLIRDLKSKNSQKAIGTDKGLAKIGDGIVNLAYSVAKSRYLTNNNQDMRISRTGEKVNRTILSNALKNAGMRNYARTRSDAHALADTVEAIIAYVWLDNSMSLNDIIDCLTENLEGDLNKRSEEFKNAAMSFTRLLEQMKQYLPET